MNRFARAGAWAGLLLAAGVLQAQDDVRTVCTITVNSADEREAFRRYLPEDKYRFVELVERGRRDWLASSCRQGIRCDVLVVSGHFAGTEFYSSRFDVSETLPVDEIERVQCSDSCPGLFSQLKEVYLFGCDTLKPEPVKSASPEIVRNLVRDGQGRAEAERFARALSERHAESSRGLMRRLFANVPVIYGFSSLAPYGRVAGPMLARYFESGAADEVGTGRPSERMLRLFGPASMTVAGGLRDSEPNADYRREVCRFFDDRVTLAQKIGYIHATLGGAMPEARMEFDRIEKFLASLGDAQRRQPAVARAMGEMAADRSARASYLALVRATEDPALRVRMIALARNLDWLDSSQQRVELVHMIHDVLAAGSVGFGEVDLICTLNKDRGLEPELSRFGVSTLPVRDVARAAASACLGNADGRARALEALTSPREHEVQIAQTYLRHHPITEASELRAAAARVARMPGNGAQLRALDTLARLHVTDSEALQELTRLYASANSVAVQRAIAEIFLRAGPADVAAPELAGTLRKYRLQPSAGEDLIDVLIRRLQPS